MREQRNQAPREWRTLPEAVLSRTRFATLVLAATMTAGLAALVQTPSQQPRQLRANGTDLSYVEQGSGAPIVFVHGAVADLRFWEPQRAAFAKGHRFIAYTYRYHGTAPWPDEGKQYSAETHAADLAAFIAALKAGRVHLVGLSYGGLVAAMVATRHPELIRTLTLAEPATFSLLAEAPEGAPVLEQWGKDAGTIVAALKEGDPVKATRMLVSVVNGAPVEHFDTLPAPLKQLLLDNARTMPIMFSAPPAGISCDVLRTVKAPTLVVRGERTAQVFVTMNELVGRCIPGSRQVVIANAAHGMSYDNPAAFNKAVLGFLATVR